MNSVTYQEKGASGCRFPRPRADPSPRSCSSVTEQGGTAIAIEPVQELANAAGCQGDAGIRRPVVEVDRVLVGANRVAAGEGDVGDVAFALVAGLGSEDPRIPAQQAVIRSLEVEERQ